MTVWLFDGHWVRGCWCENLTYYLVSSVVHKCLRVMKCEMTVNDKEKTQWEIRMRSKISTKIITLNVFGDLLMI